MADDLQPYAAPAEPTFEQMFEELHTELKKLGVPDGQAATAAAQIASSPTPVSYRKPPGRPLEIDIGPALSNFPKNALAGDEPLSPGRMARHIQDRAMRGLDPTPEQFNWLEGVAPEKERRSEALGNVGRELTGVPQAIRAGGAIREAAVDPNIPTIANAATQSALAAFRPALAAKTLAAGYLAAGAKDAGIFDGAATAQTNNKGATTLPGLDAGQNAEFNRLQAKIDRGNWSTYDEQRAGVARHKELRGISNDFVRDNAASGRRMQEEEARRQGESEAAKRASAQREFDAAVERAEGARKSIQDRGEARNFENSSVGQLWQRTGVLTPGLFGFGAGLAAKALGGASNKLAAGIGAGTGGFAAQWPLAHDVLFAPVANPTKEAYEAYARELPLDHPRKAEWTEYARSLPNENPTREVASRDLYDPVKFGERFFIGAGEGALGGLAGADIANAPRAIIEGVAAVPGIARSAYNKSMLDADMLGVARNKLAGDAITASEASRGARLAGQDARRAEQGAAGDSLRRDQLRDEGAAVDAVLSARSRSAPSMPPEVHSGTMPQAFEPNALAGGRPIAKTPSQTVDVPAPPPSRGLPPPSAPVDSRVAHLSPDIQAKIGFDKNDVPYWREAIGRTRASNKLTLEERHLLGLDGKKSDSRPSTPRRELPIPEKTPVQIDDLAPMGSRRPRALGEE